jgi:hypothetical protein
MEEQSKPAVVRTAARWPIDPWDKTFEDEKAAIAPIGRVGKAQRLFIEHLGRPPKIRGERQKGLIRPRIAINPMFEHHRVNTERVSAYLTAKFPREDDAKGAAKRKRPAERPDPKAVRAEKGAEAEGESHRPSSRASASSAREGDARNKKRVRRKEKRKVDKKEKQPALPPSQEEMEKELL